ncbi:MAG: MTH1187 family thiamine-binding protein [Myxococcota bacterium]|nr:MTH1187 family thiamine-binding protein [Myxococcota bacterium]
MAIAAVSIAPVGEGTSVSAFVAEALKVVRAQSGVRYRLDPMFTTLEGELPEIFDLVLKMEEAVFAAGAERVGTVLKIDDRRDREVAMDDKVEAVERQIGPVVPQRQGARSR